MPADTCKLLLSHTPDNHPRAVRAGVDVMLAGHNHGGQICLPVIGPIYAPSTHGVRHAGGTYREGDMLLHVSRGLAGKQPVRSGARPEITRITLQRTTPQAEALAST